MKSYCKNCESFQTSAFRLGHDAITGDPYEDLCCDTCFFVVASVQERKAQPAREWVWLTSAEVIDTMPDDDTPMSLGEAFSMFAELLEAKLKEKNT